jgi:hypothetical protein
MVKWLEMYTSGYGQLVGINISNVKLSDSNKRKLSTLANQHLHMLLCCT